MSDDTTVEATWTGTIRIEPVGVVRNDLPAPPLVAGEDGLKLNGVYDSAIEKLKDASGSVSEIILADNADELLDGIEEYSHVVVLYWGHEVPDSGRALKKIHPAGLTDYPLKGIYATCSPSRPNPLLMTVVRLVKRSKNGLFVSGLDAIDGSPVLDIKPYVAELFPHEGVGIPDWMKMVMREFNER